jgi:hypothetical protein
MRKKFAYLGDSMRLLEVHAQNPGLLGSGFVAKIDSNDWRCVEEKAKLENHRGPIRLALLLGLSKA